MVVERTISPRQSLTSRWYNGWLKRRLPAANEIKLSNRRLFIFPTRAGFAWAGLLLLCWLVATNYENNVVFGFTCLLTSLFVVSILSTYANLSGISVRYLQCNPVFAGETALAELMLSQPGKRLRTGLRLYFSDGEDIEVSLNGLESLKIKIPVVTERRGWRNPGWLRIESVYPLGLLRVWSRLDLNIRVLVYPAPVVDSPVQRASASGSGELFFTAEGSEDFVGLNDYQQGDSLKRVAWKNFARGQGMFTKHYADYQSDELWLDWDSFPACDKEGRLARLCGWLLEIENRSKAGEVYGLRIPGLEISPDSGPAHRQKVLRSLALFDLQNPGDEPPQIVPGGLV